MAPYTLDIRLLNLSQQKTCREFYIHACYALTFRVNPWREFISGLQPCAARL